MARRVPLARVRSIVLPGLTYQAGALSRSILALSKKWTLLILRDMAFLRLNRFSEFLRNNPGLTPRVLSRRLKEMQAERLLIRSGSGKAVTYALTPRGQDAVYILLAFLRYGLRYHADGRDPASPKRGPE
jgi:DNA-binding HxlR family transcriptional regulator